MNGGSFRSQVSKGVGQVPGQIKSGVAQTAKQQVGEFAKSAQEQVSGEKRVSGEHGDLYDQLTAGGEGSVDTGAIKQNEEALMSKLRSQLDAEMQRARGERQQMEQQWRERQEAQMAEPEEAQGPIEPQGGQQKGGAQGRIKQITNKREMGRGAKN